MSSEQQPSGSDPHRPIRLFAAGILVILGVISPVLVLSQDEPAEDIGEQGRATTESLELPLPAGDTAIEGMKELNPLPDGGLAEDMASGQTNSAEPEPEIRFGADLQSEAGKALKSTPKEYQTFTSVFDEALVVGFYGNPHSQFMGILGEQSIEATAEKLRQVARQYAEVTPGQRVIPAFHLIYATVWADANVGRLSSELIQAYVDYAQEHDMLVILDHQMGRFGVRESIEEMLPWLDSPVVHLAIDPEWATPMPGKEIGWISAEDLNTAQQLIQDYLIQEEIPGRKILIVHQFNRKMITNRELVRADFERVDLVHNADGFGPPALKVYSWNYNVEAAQIPLKGFKLFYPKEWKDKGYDDPLMTPEEVMKLIPRPVYINYQ
jgi:hypothetical protein